MNIFQKLYCIFFRRGPRQVRAGFTLLEMLISTFVFGISVTFLVATYLSAQQTEQAILAYVNTVENLRATLENIARDIRTGFGFPAAGENNTPWVGDRLQFTDRLNRVVEFCLGKCQFSNKQCIKKQINGICDQNSTDFITASEINITKLQFYVYGTDPAAPPLCQNNPTDQPRVTSVIEATAPFKNQDVQFKVQTTITQRLLKTCQ